jgi:hypothetical protein
MVATLMEVGLAGILFLAATTKALDLEAFRAALQAAPATRRYANRIAVAVPVAEAALAVGIFAAPAALEPAVLARSPAPTRIARPSSTRTGRTSPRRSPEQATRTEPSCCDADGTCRILDVRTHSVGNARLTP